MRGRELCILHDIAYHAVIGVRTGIDAVIVVKPIGGEKEYRIAVGSYDLMLGALVIGIYLLNGEIGGPVPDEPVNAVLFEDEKLV